MSGRHRTWSASPAGDAAHAHRPRLDLVVSRDPHSARWHWRAMVDGRPFNSVPSQCTYATRHGAQRGCERWLASRGGARAFVSRWRLAMHEQAMGGAPR